MKKGESQRMDRMWITVVCLRVVWTAMGQLGYIHPDEFFQASEIVGGKDLDNLIGVQKDVSISSYNATKQGIAMFSFADKENKGN